MMQEVEELVRFYQEGFIFFPADAGARAKLMNEMADVVITMYAAAASIGGDLHAEIDRKMQVNRKRKWKLHGDGTGQHVDE
jgi:NTP pyrophosphatase (non-canonical NTP hydrolase)